MASDSEILEFMSERIDRFEYVRPTNTKVGKFVVHDSMGERTTSTESLKDCIEEAMRKWEIANE